MREVIHKMYIIEVCRCLVKLTGASITKIAQEDHIKQCGGVTTLYDIYIAPQDHSMWFVLQYVRFMFFDRYEIHIQAFGDVLNQN